jgi:hypothetical protein
MVHLSFAQDHDMIEGFPAGTREKSLESPIGGPNGGSLGSLVMTPSGFRPDGCHHGSTSQETGSAIQTPVCRPQSQSFDQRA